MTKADWSTAEPSGNPPEAVLGEVECLYELELYPPGDRESGGSKAGARPAVRGICGIPAKGV